ncbi:MAG: protein-disulfide reductase DsbD [Thermodesulfobacteriota bacterium]
MIFLGIILFSLLPTFTIAAPPLPPDQAFSFQVRQRNPAQIEVLFRIAPGYYLYRVKFKFRSDTEGLTIGNPFIPSGQKKNDPIFGPTEILRQGLTVILPVLPPFPKDPNMVLAITYQGCSDAGLCYPPQTRKVGLKLASFQQSGTSSPSPSPSPLRGEGREWGDLSPLFSSQNFGWILLSFFGFGLLLSLTPCVFPMMPIISGIIIAQGKDLPKTRAFLLSLTYVLGMALTYAAAGVAAALSGTLISSAFQNPWVLSGFALIFVALALSMFGLYDLQLPAALQSKLTLTGNRYKAGTFAGVFIMGLLSALIIGPCVTAPLAGALLYISRTHDVLLGGTALFALSLGMGVPLLILGTSAGFLLPKAGAWMKGVKIFFGVLLLALAAWIIYPVFAPPLTSALPFQRVTGLKQLEAELERQKGLPTMLYLSADWCVSCKEMELGTFRDKRVGEKLEGMKLLKADVTETNEETTGLLKKFGLFGPPAVLFFDQEGREIPGTRVVGVQKAGEFLRTLQKFFPGKSKTSTPSTNLHRKNNQAIQQ